ncbi:MAG: toxin [Bacillales bacterium]|nr:toxin [Bacillales bacterium]
MKRILIISLLFLLLSVWPLHPHTNASITGVFLKNSNLVNEIRLRSKHTLGDIVVLPEKTRQPIEAEKMIRHLDHLPPALLQKIDQAGIKIYLFNGKLTDIPTASYLKGESPRGYANHNVKWDNVPGIGGSKWVLAKIGCSERGKGHGSVSLELHELGHSVDRYIYNDPFGDLRFHAMWKKEAPVLFPHQSYFIDFQEEYFAETFAMFYLNSQTRAALRQHAPETYHYFADLEKSHFYVADMSI